MYFAELYVQFIYIYMYIFQRIFYKRRSRRLCFDVSRVVNIISETLGQKCTGHRSLVVLRRCQSCSCSSAAAAFVAAFRFLAKSFELRICLWPSAVYARVPFPRSSCLSFSRKTLAARPQIQKARRAHVAACKLFNKQLSSLIKYIFSEIYIISNLAQAVFPTGR